jgi:hypothetical protein
MIFNGVVLAGVRKRKTSLLVAEIKINNIRIQYIASSVIRDTVRCSARNMQETPLVRHQN